MIVLDTHAWIWWTWDPKRLGRQARAAIDAAGSIGVPSICGWEVTLLVERRRIELDRGLDPWLRAALALDRVESLPLTNEIAVAAAQLDQERFPADPADRFIYATAIQHGARLATADAAISEFDPARTIWD